MRSLQWLDLSCLMSMILVFTGCFEDTQHTIFSPDSGYPSTLEGYLQGENPPNCSPPQSADWSVLGISIHCCENFPHKCTPPDTIQTSEGSFVTRRVDGSVSVLTSSQGSCKIYRPLQSLDVYLRTLISEALKEQ